MLRRGQSEHEASGPGCAREAGFARESGKPRVGVPGVVDADRGAAAALHALHDVPGVGRRHGVHDQRLLRHALNIGVRSAETRRESRARRARSADPGRRTLGMFTRSGHRHPSQHFLRFAHERRHTTSPSPSVGQPLRHRRDPTASATPEPTNSRTRWLRSSPASATACAGRRRLQRARRLLLRVGEVQGEARPTCWSRCWSSSW